MFGDELMPTTHCDWEMSELADRHYSRKKKGALQFTPGGRKLILRDAAATILFAWVQEIYRRDGQTGVNCLIFRNESDRKASEIILEAEGWARREWGESRFFTYVDPRKVRGNPPGNCFMRAGWRFERVTQAGKHLLVKEPTRL